MRWRHILTGGQMFGRWTISLLLASIVVTFGFAFSIDSTEIPRSTYGRAMTVKRNENLTTQSDWQLAEATQVCRQLTPNGTIIYRKPVVYSANFGGANHREGNTVFDRLIGSVFVSCTGNRLGETLPTDKQSRETVQVQFHCCEPCKAQRHLMKLETQVLVVTPNNTTSLRTICAEQDTTLIRKSISELKARNITKAPYSYLHNTIVPEFVWQYDGHSETREYVIGTRDGTTIDWCVGFCIFLVPFAILYAIDCWKGKAQFHGLGESEILAWWSLAWYERARSTHDHCIDDEDGHKFVIDCKLLQPIVVIEESKLAGELAFDRARIKLQRMQEFIYDTNLDIERIPKHLCPICSPHDLFFPDTVLLTRFLPTPESRFGRGRTW